jgi:hypothetical protein
MPVQECQTNATSSYKPYLDLLPESQLTPLVFSSDEIANIQYAPAMAAVSSYQHLLVFKNLVCQCSSTSTSSTLHS